MEGFSWSDEMTFEVLVIPRTIQVPASPVGFACGIGRLPKATFFGLLDYFRHCSSQGEEIKLTWVLNTFNKNCLPLWFIYIHMRCIGMLLPQNKGPLKPSKLLLKINMSPKTKAKPLAYRIALKHCFLAAKGLRFSSI